MNFRNYRTEILIIIILAITLFLASGCTAKPPCETWVCKTEELRQEFISKCRAQENSQNFDYWKFNIPYRVNYHCDEKAKAYYK